MASTLGSRLYLWRAAEGQVEALVDLDAFLRGEAGASNTIYSLAVSPDRATLATASYDGRVRLWNSRLSPRRTLVVDLMPLTTVCWSPDGAFLATSSSSRMTSAAGFEHRLLIWREADGALLPEVTRTNPISRLAWSPAGGYLASAGEGYLQIWRVGS